MSLDKNHSDDSALQKLRDILFKQEASRISAIEEVHHDPALYTEEVAKVIAEAIALRSKEDKDLGKAMRPAIEDALNISISENPKPLSDALFPVMGPAIRKAIQHAIAGMLQSLNKSLEYAFSVKSLKWRLEAARTGKSFAEVLLLHTLKYRVEQIFWIHKESGLLLKHLSFDPSLDEDADVVSSMLTAVRDFIQDSFAGDGEQEVQSMRLGDLVIFVEQAPDSVLAMVCRGNPPLSLRENMEQTLENLQQEFHPVLNNFEGDATLFDSAQEQLSSLMLVDYVNEEKKKSPVKLLVGVGLSLLILLGYWGWGEIQDIQQQERWHAYVKALKSQDGIVVTDAKEENGQYYISGLRDGLSVDPVSMLSQFQFNKKNVHYDFQPYHALQADFVLKRIRQRLSTPETVSMHIKDGVLYVSGKTSSDWIKTFHAMRYWIDGVHAINDKGLHERSSLLDRVKKITQPPDSIMMTMQDSKLLISGSSTAEWLQHARNALQGIKEVTAYDDKSVEIIDSLSAILRRANEALNPPKTVRLYVTKTKRIVAKGYASSSWITQAKHGVKTIAYARGFDDKKLQTIEQFVLQHATKVLLPPSSVHLTFSKGTLIASGQADVAWMKMAKGKALGIKGVEQFDVSNVQLSVSSWQTLKTVIDKTQLVSLANSPTLQSEDKRILQTLASRYQKALKLNPSSVLAIDFSYGSGEKLVTQLRYKKISQVLAKYGLKEKHVRLSFHGHKQSTQGSHMTFTLLSDRERS